MFHVSLYLVILTLACIIGFRKRKNATNQYQKALPIFLTFILFIELTGQVFSNYKINNTLLYNLATTAEF
jgi:heme/copper-type cytochrome/quinol oxidase subunit 2